MVMRQALSGMLWSKQYYAYNVQIGWSERESTLQAEDTVAGIASGPTFREFST